MKIDQFAQYINNLNPQKNTPRVTLFNYLKCFWGPDALLNVQLLNHFFSHTLSFPFWQQNRQELSKEVKFLVDRFYESQSQHFDYTGVIWPTEMQIFELEHFQELKNVLNRFYERSLQTGEQFRLIEDQEKRAIALILKTDQTLQVSTFDKRVTLRSGHVEPLRHDLTVYYDQNLHLDSRFSHMIEVAPYVLARFQAQGEGYMGHLIRGYIFQKHLELLGGPLAEQPKIFLPLKKLELFFIDRSQDAFYRQTIEMVQTAIERIEIGDAQSDIWGAKALAKAEEYYENVFMGDRALMDLLKLLRRHLKNQTQGQQWQSRSNTFDSINS